MEGNEVFIIDIPDILLNVYVCYVLVCQIEMSHCKNVFDWLTADVNIRAATGTRVCGYS